MIFLRLILIVFILSLLSIPLAIANNSEIVPNSAELNVFDTAPIASDLPKLIAIAKQLQNHKTLRASFKQNKKIAALRRPLLSQGSMLYSEKHGLYWHIEKPFVSSLRLSKKSIEQKDSHGNWQSVAEGSPEIAKVSSVFLALLSGNVKQMSEHFILYFQQDDTNWIIGLKPKTTLLKKVMARIQLKGDNLVREITTWDINGDQSQIQFYDSVTQPIDLTPDETKKFLEE